MGFEDSSQRLISLGRLLACTTVQPHLSQQPTRLHIVLNEQHAPPSPPPLSLPPSVPYQRDVAGTDGVPDNPHMACKVTLSMDDVLGPS